MVFGDNLPSFDKSCFVLADW